MGAVASCLSGNGRHLLAAAHQGDAASVREVQPGGWGCQVSAEMPPARLQVAAGVAVYMAMSLSLGVVGVLRAGRSAGAPSQAECSNS